MSDSNLDENTPRYDAIKQEGNMTLSSVLLSAERVRMKTVANGLVLEGWGSQIQI